MKTLQLFKLLLLSGILMGAVSPLASAQSSVATVVISKAETKDLNYMIATLTVHRGPDKYGRARGPIWVRRTWKFRGKQSPDSLASDISRWLSPYNEISVRGSGDEDVSMVTIVQLFGKPIEFKVTPAQTNGISVTVQ